MVSLSDRLSEKSIPVTESGCVIWDGWVDRDGYGRIKIGSSNYAVHRVAWELNFGPIPYGMSVCHHCDVPACINQTHLFIGNNSDNVADKVAKHRQARGSMRRSAKLTERDVTAILQSNRTALELARQYGIDRSKIYRIRSGDSWKHVK